VTVTAAEVVQEGMASLAVLVGEWLVESDSSQIVSP
jgi:hypothetical protein